MNHRLILYVLGIAMLIESAGILACGVAGVLLGDSGILFMIISSMVVFYLGGGLYLANRQASTTIGKREVYAIVIFGWLLLTLFGALPYLISRQAGTFTNAFFESLSGFTTTGASIFPFPEKLPYSLLLWRGLSQWLGGLAILILSLAVLPMVGAGGQQLFVTVPNLPSSGRFHPRIVEASKRLVAIYLALTLAEISMLSLAGLSWFESVAHSLTTISTGGFTINSQNINHYTSGTVHYILTFFMFLSGINFTLAYFAVSLRFRYVIANQEIRWYAGIVAVFAAILSLGLYLHSRLPVWDSIRVGLFDAVSILSTTGYYITDDSAWHPMVVSVILIMMLAGASSGTASGGLKVLRVSLLIRNIGLELRRMVHPNAILPLRYSGYNVDNHVVTGVLVYVVLYLILILTGSILVSAFGMSFLSALGSVISCLGNIGPGISENGPFADYVSVAPVVKWIFMVFMLLGRFEIFGFLLIFFPSFWRR